MSFVSLWQRGYVIDDVDPKAFNLLKAECMRMLDSQFEGCTPYNMYLAGAIEHEYIVENKDVIESLKPSILKAAMQYMDNYNYYYDDKVAEIKVVWANYQRKGEFNPLHMHDGNLSFVIYVHVPYKHEDENTIKGTIGSFTFYYPDFYEYGGVGAKNIPVDETFEGKILLFPADQQHSVSPFLKSDGIRISVAGNLIISRNGDRQANEQQDRGDAIESARGK